MNEIKQPQLCLNVTTLVEQPIEKNSIAWYYVKEKISEACFWMRIWKTTWLT